MALQVVLPPPLLISRPPHRVMKMREGRETYLDLSPVYYLGIYRHWNRHVGNLSISAQQRTVVVGLIDGITNSPWSCRIGDEF